MAPEPTHGKVRLLAYIATLANSFSLKKHQDVAKNLKIRKCTTKEDLEANEVPPIRLRVQVIYTQPGIQRVRLGK